MSDELRLKQIDEAVTRLKLLQLPDYVAEELKGGNRYYSQHPLSSCKCGVYLISDIPEAADIAEEVSWLESVHSILIYHIVEVSMPFARCLGFLFVSEDEDRWDNERQYLADGRPFAFIHSVSEPSLSRFGEVELKMNTEDRRVFI